MQHSLRRACSDQERVYASVLGFPTFTEIARSAVIFFAVCFLRRISNECLHGGNLPDSSEDWCRVRREESISESVVSSKE